MQRESLIQNPNERHQIELLAHSIGNAFEEMSQATAAVAPLFRNVSIGNHPGEFRLTERLFRPLPQQQGGQQAGGQGQPRQASPSMINMPSGANSGLQNVGQILSGVTDANTQAQHSIIFQ